MISIVLLILLLIPPENKIEIKDAWVRTAVKGLNSALYFQIENKSDKPDTLYMVTSDIAKHVQIHETYKKDDMMGMREVKSVTIAPNSKFEFKPGSFHIMLLNLSKDIKPSDKINFILFFKSAGQVKINSQAREK